MNKFIVCIIFGLTGVGWGESSSLIEDAEKQHTTLQEDSEGIVLGRLVGEKTEFASAGAVAAGGAKPDGRTLFEIGSITKVFTSLLLAETVREGKASFDDPMTKFLPEGTVVNSSPFHEITLEELATHTSGLPRLQSNFVEESKEEGWNPYIQNSVELLYEYLQIVRADDLTTRGEVAYSNLGVGLLGHLLSLIWERPYEELIEEKIFQPLGMKSSFVQTTLDARPETLVPRIATGHLGGEVTDYWEFTGANAGAGAIVSCGEDLLKFALAHWHPKAPAGLAASMKEIAESRIDMTGDTGMCLGWMEKDGVLTHNGGTGGFRSDLSIDVSKQTAELSLANSGGSSGEVEVSGDFTQLAGWWEGKIEAGGGLRQALLISDDGLSQLFSIDQGGAPMDASLVREEGGRLSIVFPSVEGSYEGKLAGDALEGSWTQGDSYPLNFSRSDGMPVALKSIIKKNVSGDFSPLVGFWSGYLGNDDSGLFVVAKVADLDGSFLVQVFSPDQHPGAIPCGRATFENGELNVAVPSVDSHYEGQFNAADKEISGAWFQGKKIPLDLTWSAEMPVRE